jgi:phospholipid-translocating ATPase
MLLAVIVALAPRYIFRAIQTTYYPTDLDILRYNRKYRPEVDVTAGAYAGNRLAELKRSASRTSRASRASASGTQGRPSMDPRMASRTDMASGMRSVHRGFDFITEEPGGVAMRRIQTNLSERRTSQLNLSRPPRRSTTLLRSLRLSMSRKKRPTGHADLDHDDER